jgi:tRNA modification GTPase
MEIDCHDNPLIIRSVIEDFEVSGCRIADPGKLTKRACLNHKIDLCQMEAILDVIHAINESAPEISQKQLRGTLSANIFHFSDTLLSLLAEIETRIDFADEDVEFDETISDKLNEIPKEIDKVIDIHRFRKILLHGISVEIVGHPNVGRSSLLNALQNEERAFVSDISGTTRDFVSKNIIIEVFLIKIIDTAWIRTTNDVIEQLGIAKTIENMHTVDLCLIIVDQNTLLHLEEAIAAELQKKYAFSFSIQGVQKVLPTTYKSASGGFLQIVHISS